MKVIKSLKTQKPRTVIKPGTALNPCIWEAWVEQRIGSPLTGRGTLDSYQFHKLQENYTYVRQNSSFYKKLYEDSHSPAALETWEDFKQLPFTSGEDIRDRGMQMLCVSQSQISRVVTLDTSGTTGFPKRFFFTKEDQELTVDFFHYGMETLTGPEDRVMLLLPGCRDGGLADLLRRGVERIPADVSIYGLVKDVGACAEEIYRQKSTVLVGIPVQVQALAAHCRMKGITSPVKRVLLSTDVLSDIVRYRIEEGLNCQVFNHFGMTEMGYGGALECQAHQGMHIRENDLYVEVVEPQSGKELPDGSFGEMVITTLTRKGMPLIRYRTGDRARILDGSCPCKSLLKRLDGADGRLDAIFDWKKLDDMIFSDETVVDYDAYCDVKRGLLHISRKRYFEQIPYRGKRQVRPYEELVDETGTDRLTLQADMFYRKCIYNNYDS